MKSHVQRKQPIRQTSPSRFRPLIFAAIVIVVLGTAGYLLVSAFSSRTPPPAANTVDISAAMDGFNMSEIRLKVGQPITVRLTSLDNSHHTDGGGQHQWAIDEFSVSVIAPPLGSNSVTFTPDKPGTYTFYCDICCGGRANPTMQGTLIVEA
ncbi:MAG: cupredoxin domain-containing protein [Anaerolineae bacterium]